MKSKFSEYHYWTTYKKFQQRLNECPVHIQDYQDHTDHAIVIFDLPLEPEEENSYE